MPARANPTIDSHVPDQRTVRIARRAGLLQAHSSLTALASDDDCSHAPAWERRSDATGNGVRPRVLRGHCPGCRASPLGHPSGLGALSVGARPPGRLFAPHPPSPAMPARANPAIDSPSPIRAQCASPGGPGSYRPAPSSLRLHRRRLFPRSSVTMLEKRGMSPFFAFFGPAPVRPGDGQKTANHCPERTNRTW